MLPFSYCWKQVAKKLRCGQLLECIYIYICICVCVSRITFSDCLIFGKLKCTSCLGFEIVPFDSTSSQGIHL